MALDQFCTFFSDFINNCTYVIQTYCFYRNVQSTNIQDLNKKICEKMSKIAMKSTKKAL